MAEDKMVVFDQIKKYLDIIQLILIIPVVSNSPVAILIHILTYKFATFWKTPKVFYIVPVITKVAESSETTR